MRLGIATGLVDEAACLAATALPVRCLGPGPARAAAAARELVAEGADLLVSFGVAGALARTLPPGALIVAEAVRLPDGRRLATAPAPRADLARLLGAHVGLLAGSDVAVTSPEAKKSLRDGTGALAVDMESHAVALVAAEAALPFLAVRAVVDAADDAVSDLALAGMGPDGRGRPWRVLAGLLARPDELPALLRLARNMRTAKAALRRAAAALAELEKTT